MKKNIFQIILLLLFSSFLSFSCKIKKIEKTNKINVICTIFPLYDWTSQIIGNDENINLSLLVKNGVDLHNFQPSTSDIVNISSCDVFIYVGGESDSWVDEVLKNSVNQNQKVINLMNELNDFLCEEEFIEGMQVSHEHEHEHGEKNHENHQHENHNEIEYDEHIWLSLKNAQICSEKITSILCETNSINEQNYHQNYENYKNQLINLDTEFSNSLKNLPFDTVIFCDRFPFLYLFRDYSINYFAAFNGCSAETEASFETVAFLSNKLKELKLNSIIKLEKSNDKLANTIIANAKMPSCNILTLDSMQTTTLREVFEGKTYIQTMKKNLENLQKALNKNE